MMNEPAYEQKRNETAAFVAIKKRLHSLGVKASDLRISDGLCTYGLDYGLSDDELKGLNRRFLQYLTERPEEAIRRYITEEAPLTLAKDGAVKEFSEKRSLAVLCRMLHERGIERDHDEIRASAVKQLRMRPKLKNLQGVYEAFEQMLQENPVHEFPRIFGKVKG
jgi:hypothetical protein